MVRTALLLLLGALPWCAAWATAPLANGVTPCSAARCAALMVLPASRPAVAVSSSVANPALSETLQSFLEHFRGHFDNHAQVEREAALGLTPREGGGHEHIHCVVTPLTMADRPCAQQLLASYYFDGQPSAVFRQRVYEVEAIENDPQFGACLRMSIFKLRPDAQQQLQAGMGHDAIHWSGANDLAAGLRIADADVFWRWCGERFEGQMRTESIELVSERSGRMLTVRDDVALWKDALWVNDRGTDSETGTYVYGNIHDVPYKMQRVSERHWTATGARFPADTDTDNC